MLEGLVQAKESALVASSATVVAGTINVFKIQSKDYYGNVVVNTNELFGYVFKN